MKIIRREKALLLAIALICIVIMVAYQSDYFAFYATTNKGFTETFQHRSHVLFTEGCKVPKFDPFDPTVVEYYSNVSGDIPCKGKKYINVKNNMLILNKTKVIEDFNEDTFECTYKPIYRNPYNESSNADRKFGYGNETLLIFNRTLTDEFVRVFCRVKGNITYEDFFATTPIKFLLEQRCQKDLAKIKTKNPLNVIIVGIDSVSKLNFERHFKLTAEYLRKNLSAFEFHGYMKVADNTFPNLTPLLTGHFIDHYYNESNRWRYFDDLDFIWKNFSSLGYRTLYAEDAPDMGTFHYVKSGFRYPPTDYFFRPFTLAIEDSPYQKASNKYCFQANPEIVVLFNYLRSFLNTMKNKQHFSLTWAARLTHNELNRAGHADKPTYELLRDIHDMGFTNNSVLVFLSDHGIRFGDIRQTFIGKIEERMPFLFISFPEWFLQSNPTIKENLLTNQKRLTTPFDLHETFVDIYQLISLNKSHIPTPYGISLFKEIPSGRNCQQAFILPHWCVCHEYQEIKQDDAPMLVNATAELISTLNNITSPYRHLCEELELDDVLDARVSKPEDKLLRYKELKDGSDEKSITFGEKSESFEKIMLTVRTKPGAAEFESTLRKIENNYKVFDISRINLYGNQGDCVNDSNVRKYCYCRNL